MFGLPTGIFVPPSNPPIPTPEVPVSTPDKGHENKEEFRPGQPIVLGSDDGHGNITGYCSGRVWPLDPKNPSLGYYIQTASHCVVDIYNTEMLEAFEDMNNGKYSLAEPLVNYSYNTNSQNSQTYYSLDGGRTWKTTPAALVLSSARTRSDLVNGSGDMAMVIAEPKLELFKRRLQELREEVLTQQEFSELFYEFLEQGRTSSLLLTTNRNTNEASGFGSQISAYTSNPVGVIGGYIVSVQFSDYHNIDTYGTSGSGLEAGLALSSGTVTIEATSSGSYEPEEVIDELTRRKIWVNWSLYGLITRDIGTPNEKRRLIRSVIRHGLLGTMTQEKADQLTEELMKNNTYAHYEAAKLLGNRTVILNTLSTANAYKKITESLRALQDERKEKQEVQEKN